MTMWISSLAVFVQRLRERWRLVIGSLCMGLLLSSSIGCMSPACTQVGCFNAIRIDLQRAIPWETTPHSVLLCIGTACLKALGTSDQWEDATGTLGGRLFVGSASPQYLQWEDGLQRPLQLDDEITLEVVDIETGAREVDNVWRPRWSEIRPNGARCLEFVTALI
jgi:hypothetical protein